MREPRYQDTDFDPYVPITQCPDPWLEKIAARDVEYPPDLAVDIGLPAPECVALGAAIASGVLRERRRA